MDILTLLQRNIKWRFYNAFTIVITILQPMLWLVLYSTIAGQAMKGFEIGNYTAFILPGLFVLVSFGACSSSGMMNYMMKTDGSFYRILIAPVKRSSIVLSQVLEAAICTFIEVIIMCLVSIFFSVHIASGITGVLLLSLLVFLTALFLASLAYTISLCLPNEVVYETVMTALILPIFFLSTALFPTNELSEGLKIALNLNPFTHVINVLRDLIVEGKIVVIDILFVVFLLVILCSISFSLAIHKLKKETDL